MSNILLIEDNEAIIMGLEYLFTNNGYNVRVARSAYQAKEILDNAKETEKYRTLIGAGDVWNIDIVIMSSQFGSAEVGIYPLFVIGGKFGNDIDSGLPDITHILGSPSVVCLARCDVARLDMYA